MGILDGGRKGFPDPLSFRDALLRLRESSIENAKSGLHPDLVHPGLFLGHVPDLLGDGTAGKADGH